MELNPIRLTGVRQNNLKNIDVEIPQRQLTVITGLSGSGKSTLAFDTLYAEGQRRYVESLSTYTRQFLAKMPKPDLDQIENIPPAIALEQRNTVQNTRSTVATQTEMLDFLRLFFSKLGTLECETCAKNNKTTTVHEVTPEKIQHLILEWGAGKKVGLLAPLVLSADTPVQGNQFLSNYFAVLSDQGFRRVYWSKTKTWLELTDPIPAGLNVKALFNQELYLLMDRFNFSSETKQSVLKDPDLRSRFVDSLDQTLRYGHEKALVLNLDDFQSKLYQTGFCCTDCGTIYPQPTPQLFSYNSPLGACSVCRGFGHTLDLSERKIYENRKLSISDGAIDPLFKPSMRDYHKRLLQFCSKNGIRPSKRFDDLSVKEKQLLWAQIEEFFKDLEEQKYKFHIRIFIRRYQDSVECVSCKGSRLNPTALRIKIRDKSIADLLKEPLSDLLKWFESLKLNAAEKALLKDLYPQILKRLGFLCRVGVPYLTLHRLTRTLSGGEFQRINLATHLGNGLCGTLYVLDEPTIGLHPYDTNKLLEILRDLRAQGNTLVVVEHETKILKDADWIIEMGPEAGKNGGAVAAMGTPKEVAKVKCKTAPFLKPASKPWTRKHPLRENPTPTLTLTGCSEHNLKNITVHFPLKKLVVVTGVSGSGKTTLVHQTLANALLHSLEANLIEEADDVPEESDFNIGKHESMIGHESIHRLVLLDQRSIGKNSRSNPATYMKAWDEIRKIYANQSIALARGYTAGFFSFNVDGGRCLTCKGEGEVTIDMHFMSEIKLKCEDCDGRRFMKPLLDVKYKNKSISDLLEMTIDDAFDLFHEYPILRKKFSLLKEVGLGYLELGQPGPTLSGGEAQRLKIAHALDTDDHHTHSHELFILDEPTTGLHQEDVDRLMTVLHHLVERGKSVILIEHHLEVIANSDYVVDLGPEGGARGGDVVAQCTPEQLRKIKESKTGAALIAENY